MLDEMQLLIMAVVLLTAIVIGDVVGNLLSITAYRWMSRRDALELERLRAKEREK